MGYSLGYAFTQSALLVMYYGFDINIPKWVLWFPTIILGIVLIIIIIIFILAIIFGE